VVKAALLIRRVPLPPLARHGITDPRANSRLRLRLAGQRVQFQNVAADHSEIFPEFLKILGYRGALPRFCRVIDLLHVVPSIHRTFTQVVASSPIFVPVERFELRYRRGSVWLRMCLVRTDKDVREALPATRSRRAYIFAFSQVESGRDRELWFETLPVRAHTRGIDNAIGQLAARVRGGGVAAILTSQGYRFYLVDTPPSLFVPYLAAMYGVIFYLGSITRYKPDVFDKIISGKESWIVEEFLASLPTQFLYGLASELAGVDVVRPYAAVS
jgi:YaaC-like Protein